MTTTHFRESFTDRQERALRILQILEQATQTMTPPMTATIIQEYGRNPFLVLISCLLSLRTKDTTTLPASRRLFERAMTPQQLLAVSSVELEALIYPVGFFRRKAQGIHVISRVLLDQYAGKVPSTEQELLALPGVGRKTAALVLSEGFEIPAICVDVHVHRIANRLGLVVTQDPHETERALKELLPAQWWGVCNRLLVVWGQNICTPVSPRCSGCVIAPLCPRIGVTKHR